MGSAVARHVARRIGVGVATSPPALERVGSMVPTHRIRLVHGSTLEAAPGASPTSCSDALRAEQSFDVYRSVDFRGRRRRHDRGRVLDPWKPKLCRRPNYT